MTELVVGILQEGFGPDPLDNFKKISSYVDNQHREADLIVLPEYSMINVLANLSPERVYELSEEVENSGYLSKLSDLAGRSGVHLLAHFIERSSVKPKCYSSTVIVKPSGGLERLYSKMHLFDAYGYMESSYFLPGKSLSRAMLISDRKYFAAICYDIRFPELFRQYAYMNSYGVFVQAGWVRGHLKEELLDTLARSRSHENTMYVVLANQTGELYTGRSGVFNPYGYRELDLGFKPQYCEHRIDPSIVDEARAKIPVVKQSLDRWIVNLRD